MKFRFPDLHRVDPGRLRGLVDHPLEEIGRLRPAGAAQGIDRGGVGEHRLDVAEDRRGGVLAGEQRRVEKGRDQRREGREIRPHIGDGVDPEAGELAVGVERELDLGHVVAAVRVGHEALRPLSQPAYRPLQLARRPADDRVLRIGRDLGSEAAADIRRDHPELVLRLVEHEGAEQQAHRMRGLGGAVEGELLLALVVLGHRRARLHRMRDDALVDELQPRGVRRRLESGVNRLRRFLAGEIPVEAEIVGRLLVDLRRAVQMRGLGDRRRIESLVVDFDELGRIRRLFGGLGDDRGHDLADIAHLALRDDRPFGLDHGGAVLRRDTPAAGQAADPVRVGVRPGQHRHHAGRRLGLRRVDRTQSRVAVRRAQHMGV